MQNLSGAEVNRWVPNLIDFKGLTESYVHILRTNTNWVWQERKAVNSVCFAYSVLKLKGR